MSTSKRINSGSTIRSQLELSSVVPVLPDDTVRGQRPRIDSVCTATHARNTRCNERAYRRWLLSILDVCRQR